MRICCCRASDAERSPSLRLPVRRPKGSFDVSEVCLAVTSLLWTNDPRLSRISSPNERTSFPRRLSAISVHRGTTVVGTNPMILFASRESDGIIFRNKLGTRRFEVADKGNGMATLFEMAQTVGNAGSMISFESHLKGFSSLSDFQDKSIVRFVVKRGSQWYVKIAGNRFRGLRLEVS